MHAIALVVDQGRKVKDVAQDLGISEYLLYDWRRQLPAYIGITAGVLPT